jgi:hypothetical protein
MVFPSQALNKAPSGFRNNHTEAQILRQEFEMHQKTAGLVFFSCLVEPSENTLMEIHCSFYVRKCTEISPLYPIIPFYHIKMNLSKLKPYLWIIKGNFYY